VQLKLYTLHDRRLYFDVLLSSSSFFFWGGGRGLGRCPSLLDVSSIRRFLLLLLYLSVLPCSVGSSVHCLKAILSPASLFISAKVFSFLLATSITQSSQVVSDYLLVILGAPFWVLLRVKILRLMRFGC
jgi:hypothetical protein